MSFNAVILAAGEGKRMKSKFPKVLHKVCGKALVEWVIGAAKEAGVKKNIVVVGHLADSVKGYLGDSVEYAMQKEQLGTGHAVMQAVDMLEPDSVTLVTCGDMPLITGQTLKDAFDYHMKNQNSLTVLTAELGNPYGYGRIIRNADGVSKIVEEKDANAEEKAICEINSGTYFFDTKLLIECLGELKNENAQNEYYLTDTVKLMLDKVERVNAFTVKDNAEISGINDRKQLAEAAEYKRRKIIENHMYEGVTFIDPATTYIEANVKIGMDTVIYPQTSIEANSVIGEDCVIGGSKIVSSTIGNGTDILNSVITNSVVGNNTHVGPFAYLRPNAKVGNNVKIGDFVEIKNTVIDDGTKVSHLTYLGDADIGKNVNFGCGTVIVNYDGAKKYRCKVDDNCFIGCNTNLVSPVTVHKGAFVAAGSTITDDIPEDAFAIARSRQVIKMDWKKNKQIDK